METKKIDSLQLIPKAQDYIEYMLEIIIKLPRTEKFNIGNEYKQSLYETMKYILILIKEEKSQKVKRLIQIDTELNLQRIYLRIMNKYHWIDSKRYRNII